MTMTWLTLSFACVFFVMCVAAPPRRQFSPETSSSVPAALVTGESEVWDDSDDFDLDGDEEWLGESAASPSSIPLRQDYDDYDGDDSSKRDDDVDRQDAEEDDESARRRPEFLFVPSSDSRLMLQDDDQSGLIKVRHTGKNAYSELDSNSLDEESSSKDEDDDQFEFTLGGDDDDKDDENDLEKDDFVLEDAQPKDIAEENMPKRMTHYDEEQVARRGMPDDDGDDEGEDDDAEDDPAVFESPEEDSQVIYGDHVFLY